MKVAHLLRKPCSREASTVAANLLRHGTGALNIDASRVAHDAGVDMNAVQRQQATGGNSAVKGAFGAEALVGKEIAMYKPGGRWPANLVLQHLPECRKEGTKKVKGQNPKYVNDGMGGTNFVYGGGMGPRPAHVGIDYADEDGTETVTAWACVEGCPVAALDRQSGELTSGSWNGHRNKAKTKPGIYAPFVLRDEVGTQGSKGGASRFFKQVKP